MTTRFTLALSLSVRMLAAACGTALLAAPGCNVAMCDEHAAALELHREASPTTATLRAVAVDSNSRAVAVGDGGALLTRDDGGAWQAQASGVTADLFGVAFSRDDARVIAVGAGGAVLISYTGDGTWVTVDTGVTADLRAVTFLDDSRAVAVGDGVVLRSDDAGETWVPAETPVTANLRSVAALASLDGPVEVLAVGANGVVLRSGDAVTWQLVDAGLSGDLLSVGVTWIGEDSGDADGNGWVVLGEGQIWRGAAADALIAEPTDAELLGVSPRGDWQVGGAGEVRWTASEVYEGPGSASADDPDGARLLAVAGHAEQGIAVGEGGVILRAEQVLVKTGEHRCDPSIVDGRPFVVDEHARTAEAAPRRDWCDEIDVARLPASTRARLAAAWTRDALFEHASIASFARFVLQLLAVGAPPDLVLAGQAALADEVRHAQACFGLASAFAGEPIGPGPLAIDGALAGPCELAELAGATAVEGCVNETIAALMASTAAELAQDLAVREQLAAIAADERRHAALAWRTVAWALARGDAGVRAAVARAFAREPAPAIESGEDGLESHGRLSRRARVAVARAAWREVIVPHAAALLGQPATTSASPWSAQAGAAAM